MSVRDTGNRIVSQNTDDWTNPRELLEGETEQLGVMARDRGAAVRNGSVHEFEELDFYLGPVEQVRGDVVVLSGEVVQEPLDEIGQKVISLQDRNEAGFYVGASDGFETFEAKCDQNYTLYDSEAPHIHDSKEVYSPRGGSFLLAMAGPDYDFTEDDPESWNSRDDIVYQEVREGEVFEVPEGVPHRVAAQFDSPEVPAWIDLVEDQRNLNGVMQALNDEEPDHIVFRYGEAMGKYDLDGSPMNQWTEGNMDYEQMRAYSPEENKKVVQ